MARRGRPKKTGGGVFSRPDSQFLYVWYPDGKGAIVKESSGTMDREEAERFLRERLNARQDGKLPTLLAGKRIIFDEFANWFLEHRAGLKSEKTCVWYRDNLRNLRPCFGPRPLSDISADAIEDYLSARLEA